MVIPPKVEEWAKNPTKPKPTRDVSPELIADFLEEGGYMREIAGDDDFNRVVEGIRLAIKHRRGLLLMGGNGCGKSLILSIIRRDLRYSYTINCNDPTTMEDLIDTQLLDQNIIIDDFGAEKLKWGDSDAVGDFIVWWHARHVDGYKLYLAMNLTADDVNERYGGRVLDRLTELCVIVKLTGKSKRKAIVVK